MQTTTPIVTTTVQNMIAVSLSTKQFVSDEAASQFAPSKSKDSLVASQREVADAMVNFIASRRYELVTESQAVKVEETDDNGLTTLVDTGEVEDVIVEKDRFAEAIQAVLALRMDTVRANTSAAKITSMELELAELRALLASKG